MDAQNIGIFLQKLRKENNLTQKDIAKLCNISTQAVSKWERGESIPDVELLERLSILYKVSINEIINGEKKELFLDLDKRRNIIMLTASIFVFIAYLFNFFHGELEVFLEGRTEINAVLKGYQLIFNGTTGIFVYLSWFVFLILISHVLINIYTLSRVINRTGYINTYIKFSSIIVIIISIVLIISPNFYVFPQLIIILSMIIAISLINDSKDYTKIFKNLKEFKHQYKEKQISSELLLDDSPENKKIIKTNKITTILGMIIYLCITLVQIYVLISSINTFGLIMIILTTTIFVLLLKSYKYLISIYSYNVTLITGILTSILPVLMITMTFIERSVDIWNYLLYIVCLLLFALIPITLLFNAYKGYKLQSSIKNRL